MNRFHGRVGFAVNKEIEPGIFVDEFEEKFMFGNILDEGSKWDYNSPSSDASGKITINHRISIIADEFAMNNYSNIKWVEFMGQKWSVKSIQVKRPRMMIWLGDIYEE